MDLLTFCLSSTFTPPPFSAGGYVSVTRCFGDLQLSRCSSVFDPRFFTQGHNHLKGALLQVRGGFRIGENGLVARHGLVCLTLLDVDQGQLLFGQKAQRGTGLGQRFERLTPLCHGHRLALKGHGFELRKLAVDRRKIAVERHGVELFNGGVNLAGLGQGIGAHEIQHGAGTGAFGLNAGTGEYCDLIADGVVDPTKVTRSTLQNAASVSGLLLTTEAMIAEAAPEGDDH